MANWTFNPEYLNIAGESRKVEVSDYYEEDIGYMVYAGTEEYDLGLRILPGDSGTFIVGSTDDGEVTLYYTWDPKNALGIVLYDEVPAITSNTVTKAYVESLGIEAGVDAQTVTNMTTLSSVYSQTPTFSEWTILRDDEDVTAQVQQPVYEEFEGYWYWQVFYVEGDEPGVDQYSEPIDINRLTWSDSDDAHHYTATRTRTDIIGYMLGDQTNIVLATTNGIVRHAEFVTALSNYVSSVGAGAITIDNTQILFASDGLGVKDLSNNKRTVVLPNRRIAYFDGNGDTIVYMLPETNGILALQSEVSVLSNSLESGEMTVKMARALVSDGTPLGATSTRDSTREATRILSATEIFCILDAAVFTNGEQTVQISNNVYAISTNAQTIANKRDVLDMAVYEQQFSTWTIPDPNLSQPEFFYSSTLGYSYWRVKTVGDGEFHPLFTINGALFTDPYITNMVATVKDYTDTPLTLSSRRQMLSWNRCILLPMHREMLFRVTSRLPMP